MRGIRAKAAKSFLVNFEEAAEKIRRLELMAKEEWSKIQSALGNWDSMASSDRYITQRCLQKWVRDTRAMVLSAKTGVDYEAMLRPDHKQALQKLRELLRDPQAAITLRNEKFVQSEKLKSSEWFPRGETIRLTEEQKDAVVIDEDNCLVVAGAGCGKTSTIASKVAYVVHKALAKPEEILLLSFTGKPVKEMQERIRALGCGNVLVCTFHSLGMRLIADTEEKKPSPCKWAIESKDKRLEISRIISDLSTDPAFLKQIARFWGSLDMPYRPIWEFQTEDEYRKYLLEVEPRTLKGELTASYEECEIANWLALHGICYQYEIPYRHTTATVEFRQYTPDFYLPDHDIYIEHWGINRNGETARFMNNDKYRAKMDWARSLHKTQGTRLLETFSWERSEGVLLSELEHKLKDYGVAIGEVSLNHLLDELNSKGRAHPLAALFETFLSHFKSNRDRRSTIDEYMAMLRGKAGEGESGVRKRLFLDLFQSVYEKYEAKLREDNGIDFDQMISGARDLVDSGSARAPYKYILVDEFQDIGHGRAELIKSLRTNAPGCKLFCVGDDWQSIYRFAGSDLSLMTDFEMHFGEYRRFDLTQTFRFNDKIAEFSERFVMKNKDQLSKNLVTLKRSDRPQVIYHVRNEQYDPVPTILESIWEKSGGERRSVFLLYRYSFKKEPDKLKEYQARFPLLSLTAHTVHKSKGLEADYVIVDYLCEGQYGFPSRIVDDPVLEMVLPKPDKYPHAEERRLFYVALTRAKERVHLIAEEGYESDFIKEILFEAGTTYELGVKESAEQADEALHRIHDRQCPECRLGYLVKSKEKRASYFECSNRPICRYRTPSCPNCKTGFQLSNGKCSACGIPFQICPSCKEGVLMEIRNTKDGHTFLGCSNWQRDGKGCNHTNSVCESNL